MNNKASLISIDILRAVAAMGVFFYHQHVGALIGRFTGVEAIRHADNFGAEFAVPLFFLISGYCIHLSNTKHLANNQQLPLGQYYKRRFLRIYPPYLAALIFAIAVNYFTYGMVPATPDIIVHIFSVQGFSVPYFNTINLVLWTITVEIAFYIIYPLFYYIRLKYSLNKALLLAGLVSAVNIGYFSVQGSLTLPQQFWVLNLWFAWCCGAYLADKVTFDFDGLKKPVFIILYLVIVAAWLALRYIPNHLSIVYNNLNILIWTGPLIFMVSREAWFQKHHNWLVRLTVKIGLSSYSLYLLHQPLISLKNYAAHHFLPPQLHLAGVAAGILAIPLVAWFSYLLVEKPFIPKKRIAHQ